MLGLNNICENSQYRLYKSLWNDNHYIVRKRDNETMETFIDNNESVDCFKEHYNEVE